MHTAVAPTFTFPGVNAAMLRLSKARRTAYLYRCAAAQRSEFGDLYAPASAAACEAFADNFQAIADRIAGDLAAGIYEGNR